MNTSEVVVLPSNDGVSLSVELRWRIQSSEIDGIWRLHDAAFPVKYESDYYQWLLSDSCVAVVAYATPKNLSSIFSCMESGDKMEKSTSTDDNNNDNDDNDDSKNGDGTHDVNNSDSSTSYSVVVGFCIGQLAHCRQRNGQLVPSPTGYLGSFAVDARLRCRGLGELLLERFISYMFFHIPVPRHLFLNNPEETSSATKTTITIATMKTSAMNWWMSLLEKVTLYIFGYPFAFGKTTCGEERKEELVLRETERSDLYVLPNLHNNGSQRGVKEVWLHCLAEDTKLLLYYFKRGFRRVLVIPQFYTFDGETHDGMLLVCSRENIRDSTTTITDTSSGTIFEFKSEISGLGMSNASSLSGVRTRRCFITESEEGSSGDVGRDSLPFTMSSTDSDRDIVDVDITDSSKLRDEWYSNNGASMANSDYLLFSSQGTLYVMKGVFILLGIVWIVSLGF
ncbi:acetyltransferase [Trypanosoma theileri]|uniref:histone acetyltransferase n=1 Tax=Trypanosoma theileri TaxID=67003 RepID=A0A1X0P721_9TRYP|nr:acetyltransferase [Trypanosoma theileri]ORC92722.1 acetyltransferase [Trypanosoma theileri]